MDARWPTDGPPIQRLLAAEMGDLSILKDVLQHQPQHINVRGRNEFTLLICSAWGGHTHLVRYLCKMGANTNLQNHMGQTALHWSCHFCSLQQIETLLKHGADATITDQDGATPLMWAFKTPPGTRKGGQVANPEAIRMLIHLCPAVVSATDREEKTALFHAVVAGDDESTRVLINEGYADFWKGSPMREARRRGHTHCVKVLEEAERSYLMYKIFALEGVLNELKGMTQGKLTRLSEPPSLPAYLTSRVADDVGALPMVTLSEGSEPTNKSAREMMVVKEVLRLGHNLFQDMFDMLGRSVGHRVGPQRRMAYRPLITTSNPANAILFTNTAGMDDEDNLDDEEDSPMKWVLSAFQKLG